MARCHDLDVGLQLASNVFGFAGIRDGRMNIDHLKNMSLPLAGNVESYRLMGR